MCDDCNDDFLKLIEQIEKDIKVATILNQCQIGIALKVIEDRLWNINIDLAQKCNDIKHKIMNS